MKNIFQIRLDKMNDDSIFTLAVSYGRIMERGNMTKEEKERARMIFTEAANRATIDNKETFLTALKVLKFF